MLDIVNHIGLLETEPSRNDKIQKQENSVSAVQFLKLTKPDFGGLGTVFPHCLIQISEFIFQHDRINTQSISLHARSLHF